MIFDFQKKAWKILLSLVILATLVVSAILLYQFGERGKVGYAFLKVNAPRDVMPSLMILMNQANLREYVKSKAGIGREVGFFMVENMKSPDRLRIAIRFSRKTKSGFEDMISRIVSSYNDLGVVQNMYQDSLLLAGDQLVFSKEIEERQSSSPVLMFQPKINIYQYSSKLASKRLEFLKSSKHLFTIDQALVISGGKDIRVYILSTLLLVIVAGLGSLLMPRKTS